MDTPNIDLIRNHFSYISCYNLFACNKKELGAVIGFPSLTTNSLTKMPDDKIELAYADFDKEVRQFYYENWGLSDSIEEFIQAVDFYKNEDLKRMSAFSEHNKQASCMSLLEYAYGIRHPVPKDKKLEKLAEKLYDDDRRVCLINVAFLVLLILGIIDKSRDISNRLDEDFDRMSKLVVSFFSLNTPHSDCPLLRMKEIDFHFRYHNRFFLMSSFDLALILAASMADDEYELYESDKQSHRYFDIEGSLWTDAEDKDRYYKFDYNPSDVNYLMTSFSYCQGQSEIVYEEFLVSFFYDYEDKLSVFVLNARGSYYFVTRQEKLSMNETAWFYCEVDDRIKPKHLKLTLHYGKPNFDFSANCLTRLDEIKSESLIKKFEDESIKKVNKNAKYESKYLPGTGIYALTHENIFIKDIDSGEGYYCVPIENDERLESIKIDDLAGLCRICGTLYLRFEVFNLSLDISSEQEMKKSGVRHVMNIF